MPYCTQCGKEMDENASFCPQCGTPRGGGYREQPYDPSQNDPYNNPRPQYQAAPAQYDSGSIGWAILGFFIPLVGLILFLVWIGNKPKSAKMAGLGALVNVIFNIVIYVVVFVILLGSSSPTTSMLMF